MYIFHIKYILIYIYIYYIYFIHISYKKHIYFSLKNGIDPIL